MGARISAGNPVRRNTHVGCPRQHQAPQVQRVCSLHVPKHLTLGSQCQQLGSRERCLGLPLLLLLLLLAAPISTAAAAAADRATAVAGRGLQLRQRGPDLLHQVCVEVVVQLLHLGWRGAAARHHAAVALPHHLEQQRLQLLLDGQEAARAVELKHQLLLLACTQQHAAAAAVSAGRLLHEAVRDLPSNGLHLRACVNGGTANPHQHRACG
jgi:hypothetical protein